MDYEKRRLLCAATALVLYTTNFSYSFSFETIFRNVINYFLYDYYYLISYSKVKVKILLLAGGIGCNTANSVAPFFVAVCCLSQQN